MRHSGMPGRECRFEGRSVCRVKDGGHVVWLGYEKNFAGVGASGVSLREVVAIDRSGRVYGKPQG